MMMSAPAPDWIAEVMRDCRSLALTVSTLRLMPVAFLHSCVIGPLSSTSEAGTKSAHRSQWMDDSWASAGARPLARMAAMPPDADSFRTLRRAIRAMISSRHLFVCWNYVVRWNYASSVAKAAFAAAGGETATRAEVSFANYASRTTPLPQG